MILHSGDVFNGFFGVWADYSYPEAQNENKGILHKKWRQNLTTRFWDWVLIKPQYVV
jgi:hypothetical protein